MKRLCIYLVYDKQNIVDEYIGYMLQELKTSVDTLVVVCNGLEIKKGKSILETYADKLFFRENVGFDVGGFKDALCDFLGWNEVLEYDELVLINDSFFGPFVPMDSIFEYMQPISADFWGLIKHGKRMENGFFTPEHIQSFFIVVRSRMLHHASYREFWEKLPYYKTFMEVVCNYELKFTDYFSKLGFSYSVLADTEVNDSANIENNYIQYSALAYELIKKRRFPFLKKQQIAFDVLHMQTQENLRQALDYIENNTVYDVNLIWDNIIRTMNISDIQKNFALQYIIKENEKPRKNDSNVVIAVIVNHESAMEYLLEYLEELRNNYQIRIYSKDKNLLNKYDLCKYDVFYYSNIVDVLKSLNSFTYICLINDVDATSDNMPSCTGKSYLYNLFHNLVKTSHYVENVVNLFENDVRLGYLAPPKANHALYFGNWGLGWNGKYDKVKETLQSIDIDVPISEDKPPFSISNNYWIRGEILRNITLPIINDDLLSYLWIYIAQSQGFYSGILESQEYAAMNEINLQNYLEQTAFQVRQLFGKYQNFEEMKKCIFQKALNDFVRQNKQIMIYGTGGMARKYQDIIPNVVGYIVSDGQPKETEMNGIPVYFLSEVIDRKDLGIIICMLPKNQIQVIPLLKRAKFDNYICC